MNPLDLAYLAGIFDGEGTISVSYATSPNGRAPSLSCRLSIGNTCLELLEWVQSVAGGKIYTPHVLMPNAKQYWNWVLLGRPASALAAELLPHLRVKHRQAALAASVESLLMPRCGDNRRRVVTPELRARRDALVQEFRSLNARGIA